MLVSSRTPALSQKDSNFTGWRPTLSRRKTSLCPEEGPNSSAEKRMVVVHIKEMDGEKQ